MPKFQDYYPKVEYLGSDFITDTNIIHNLIFAIQQITILQETRFEIRKVLQPSANAMGRKGL